MSELGHNVVAKDQLRSIIDRIENLDVQITELRDDQKDIFKEAASNGYDVPALRAIVRARREDPEKRREREAMVDLYRGTLGIE